MPPDPSKIDTAALSIGRRPYYAMGHDNSFGSVIGASVAAIVYFGLGYYFRRKDETETNNSPSRIMCSSALSGYGIYFAFLGFYHLTGSYKLPHSFLTHDQGDLGMKSDHPMEASDGLSTASSSATEAAAATAHDHAEKTAFLSFEVTAAGSVVLHEGVERAHSSLQDDGTTDTVEEDGADASAFLLREASDSGTSATTPAAENETSEEDQQHEHNESAAKIEKQKKKPPAMWKHLGFWIYHGTTAAGCWAGFMLLFFGLSVIYSAREWTLMDWIKGRNSGKRNLPNSDSSHPQGPGKKTAKGAALELLKSTGDPVPALPTASETEGEQVQDRSAVPEVTTDALVNDDEIFDHRPATVVMLQPMISSQVVKRQVGYLVVASVYIVFFLLYTFLVALEKSGGTLEEQHGPKNQKSKFFDKVLVRSDTTTLPRVFAIHGPFGLVAGVTTWYMQAGAGRQNEMSLSSSSSGEEGNNDRKAPKRPKGGYYFLTGALLMISGFAVASLLESRCGCWDEEYLEHRCPLKKPLYLYLNHNALAYVCAIVAGGFLVVGANHVCGVIEKNTASLGVGSVEYTATGPEEEVLEQDEQAGGTSSVPSSARSALGTEDFTALSNKERGKKLLVDARREEITVGVTAAAGKSFE